MRLELEEVFCYNQGAPPKIVQHSEILWHATSIYTRKIFYLFELELLAVVIKYLILANR